LRYNFDLINSAVMMSLPCRKAGNQALGHCRCCEANREMETRQMMKGAKLAILIAALPSVAMAQEVSQNASPCTYIPQEAVTTSFDALPDAIRAAMMKFPNFSPTDAPCQGETTYLHSHGCFERAALLHNEWIVILHYVGHPDGKGHAFVWKVSGDDLTEVGWPVSYASLCTLEALGAVRDGYVVSKEEGKRAVFAPMP
jgi:hypothetical protein